MISTFIHIVGKSLLSKIIVVIPTTHWLHVHSFHFLIPSKRFESGAETFLSISQLKEK